MSDFTGYRFDLERREEIAVGSSAYQQLVGSSEEWTEGNLFEWWHVRNQGNQGSCRGHSLAASARLGYVLAAGEIDLDGDGTPNEANLQDDFSPDYCYYECQRVDNIHGDNGATIAGGIKVGLAGVAREVDLPYTQAYDPQRVTDPIREKAKQFHHGRYTQFGPDDVDKLFDWVGTNQGAIDWGTVWTLPFTAGCLVRSLSPRQGGGGHATCGVCLIRGATLMRLVPELRGMVKEDEWILQVANSHTEHAQYRGFYFCTRQGVSDILRHPMTVAIGWSDMSAPRRRRFDWTKFSPLG